MAAPEGVLSAAWSGDLPARCNRVALRHQDVEVHGQGVVPIPRVHHADPGAQGAADLYRLLAASPFVLLDNIKDNTVIDSPSLAAALTSG